MQAANESEFPYADMPSKLVVFCNGANLALVMVMDLIACFVAFMAVCYGLGGHPEALIGAYPFAASMMLTWGHKRVARTPALTRFSRVFWPIASIHYFVLIIAGTSG